MLHPLRFKILALAAFLLALAGFGHVLYQSIYGWNLDRWARNQAQQTARNTYLMCRTAQAAIHRSLQAPLSEVRAQLHRAAPQALQGLEMAAGAAGEGEALRPDQALGALLESLRSKTGHPAAVYRRIEETGELVRIGGGEEKTPGGEYPGQVLPGSDPAALRLGAQELVLFPGRAEGRWVMVALLPLRRPGGQGVAGALQVVLTSPELEQLVRRIMATLIGRDGYVFVLGGKGEQRGRYLLSKDGLRDGEDIWDSLDATGRPFIQAIVVQALALAETSGGEELPVVFERYPWQNPGEKSARHKTVAIAYFEPWDWVIGAGYYEDEF
ncbi:hypothetical protein DESUT3_39030 [Desulfuromonas versatilis]|uniref:Cache 3/Cache 2 fusion domain-containing protein n=1 Tax=Desulfuromonas versatilis TaxID=2802975 RepID=A0ABN6E595_9BACT|nr:Cache 3/Cache 2 fusion domain-containing protein [Desulfuromonas versatilis]BCR06834.1 hypothetical protein DESUT3_39030 [Desulfuromonas versatilis]